MVICLDCTVVSMYCVSFGEVFRTYYLYLYSNIDFFFPVNRVYKDKRSGDNFAFASYYGDHMVLQQSPSRSMVWGYANLDEQGLKVKVIVSTPREDYCKIYEALVSIGMSICSKQRRIQDFMPTLKTF